MSKQFLKKGEIELVNGGYLSNKDGKPVSNFNFVIAQQNAHWVMTFAAKAKGKDFKGKKADSIEALKKEVQEYLDVNKPTVFVAKPTEVKRPITNKLNAEALTWMDNQGETTKVEKINRFLQQFTVISEFEEFGLFFEDDVVKLDKIYTLKEIIEAVTETIDLLD